MESSFLESQSEMLNPPNGFSSMMPERDGRDAREGSEAEPDFAILQWSA